MHTMSLWDGEKAIVCGELAYLPDNGSPEKFPGAYQERGRGGIAWRIFGEEIEFSEDEEYYLTGRVVAVMVGDDRRVAFDLDDLVPIDREDYCGVCGQIGCRHDGLDREEG